MKKIYFIIVLSLLAMNAFGQNFNYQLDEDNEPYVGGQIEFDCSASAAWNRLVSYVKKVYTAEYNEVTIDEYARTILVNGGKENSKMRYNPMAGTFVDNIKYTLTITQDETGKAHYTFSDLCINSQAAGFANYNKDLSVRVMLRDYQKAQKVVSDNSSSKKELKEAKDSIKDLGSSLAKAYEVLVKRADSIKSEVK